MSSPRLSLAPSDAEAAGDATGARSPCRGRRAPGSLSRDNRGLLLAIALFAASPAPAESFDPARHFPSPSLCYLHVVSVARLRATARETVLGRLLTHPSWHDAAADLIARIAPHVDAELERAQATLGFSPIEVLDAIDGRVALTVRRLHPPYVVEGALAIELGAGRETILSAVRSLEAHHGRRRGAEVTTRDVDGVPARVWPSPIGSIFEVEIADHLLFVSSLDLLRTIARSVRAGRDAEGVGSSRLLEELDPALAVGARNVVAAVNLEALRPVVLGSLLAASETSHEVLRIVRLVGAHRLTAFGFALGDERGNLDLAVHLGARDGFRGLIETVASSLPALDAPDADLLARIPSNATELAGLRIAPARALQGSLRLLEREMPEIRSTISSAFAELETRTGVSYQEWAALGDLTAWRFASSPPSGGLSDDRVALVRTEELEPYWTVIDRVATRFGARQESFACGDGSIRYFRLPPAHFADVSAAAEIARLALSRSSLGSLATLRPARVDLDGGWSAVAGRTQALWRYLDAREGRSPFGGRPFADGRSRLDPAFGAGSSYAWMGRPARGFLAAYAAALEIGSAAAPLFQPWGIDLGRAPPAEVFSSDTIGSTTLTVTPRGVTLRAHAILGSGQELIELLAWSVLWTVLAADVTTPADTLQAGG